MVLESPGKVKIFHNQRILKLVSALNIFHYFDNKRGSYFYSPGRNKECALFNNYFIIIL